MAGNCYGLAARAVSENPNLTLCHGICTGTGGDVDGVRYGHAWVEYDDGPWRMARDLESGKSFFAELFRAVGNAHPVITYTYEDALAMVLTHETYGPWHPQIRLVAHADD